MEGAFGLQDHRHRDDRDDVGDRHLGHHRQHRGAAGAGLLERGQQHRDRSRREHDRVDRRVRGARHSGGGETRGHGEQANDRGEQRTAA